ncbi:MAG: head maturation protease, ClpP-related [Pseudomonadota bacterium]
MSKNELILYGSVGYDWWGDEYFTAKSVRDQLAGMSGDITVRINSGGGIASEGQAIYTMLVDYPGKVTVIVDGVAASAASLISMAGDEIIYRLGAWTLIHDPATPWTMGRGTEEDHRKEAELLGVISNAYADIYAATSGLSREECRGVMKAETVLDGAMAVEMGFATSIDAAQEKLPEAAFDYRIYANAPERLRKASRNLGRAPAQEAVMAMIAGRPRNSQPQEKTMSGKKMILTGAIAPLASTAVIAAGEGDETTPATVVVEDEPAIAPGTAEATAALNATAAERTRARRIMDTAGLAGLSMQDTTALVDSKMTLEQALDQITAKWKENGDVDTPMTGAPTARILRDEVDTRNAGMSQALYAQMAGIKPESDKANAFMQMGLVDMAAATIGRKNPIRSAGDRIEVFMAAGHSRSDFSGIFENALNKALLDRYQIAEPTYRAIARKKNFNDFRVHPMVRAGDMPKLLPVGENGEIKFGTFGEKRETAILSSYGIALRFSRQMFIDDDLAAIYDMTADYGSMVADFEEETFYAFKASAVLASDGLAVQVAGHNNLAGSGTAITVAALGAGRAAIRKQTTIDGKKLNMAPSILLVGPDKETEADQLVTSITPNLAGSVNPFSGRLTVVSSAQITGNRWELFVDPNRPGGACYVYGYLNGAEAPRIRMDEPFGTQGMAMSVEHDFGLGAIDFRGTYANAGA